MVARTRRKLAAAVGRNRGAGGYSCLTLEVFTCMGTTCDVWDILCVIVLRSNGRSKTSLFDVSISCGRSIRWRSPIVIIYEGRSNNGVWRANTTYLNDGANTGIMMMMNMMRRRSIISDRSD